VTLPVSGEPEQRSDREIIADWLDSLFRTWPQQHWTQTDLTTHLPERVAPFTGWWNGYAQGWVDAQEGRDAPSVWDASCAPGGDVCSVCRIPVESEPCAAHQTRAYVLSLS
jgi:hypothetical protein